MSDEILKAYGKPRKFDVLMSRIRAAVYGLGFDPFSWASRRLPVSDETLEKMRRPGWRKNYERLGELMVKYSPGYHIHYYDMLKRAYACSYCRRWWMWTPEDECPACGAAVDVEASEMLKTAKVQRT